MSILRAENELVLIGIESVYGTAEVLTGANAVQCDIEITPMEATPKERVYSRPYHGARPVILTEVHRACKLTNVELAGSGDPAVAPAWTAIMRACGWAAVTTATETTFTPVTDAVEGATINPSIDGEQFQMLGSKGSVSLMFEIGEFPVLEANFKGGWVDPETLAGAPTPNYNAWKIPQPVNCENTAALVIGGESYPFYSLKIDQNATVEYFCVPGEPGSRLEINKRDVKSTAKLQAKQISEHDLFALVKSNALVPVSMMHGTVAGSKVGVSGPLVQILNPRASDYKGDLAWEVDMIWTPTGAGDDEIAIVTP